MADSIAWAGGLFEGEGCISTTNPSRGDKHYGPYARLTLQMNDRDVVERFAEAVGVGAVHQHRLWSWSVSNAEDVLVVLRMLWPHLGERRKARAVEITAIATRPPKPHPNSLKIQCPAGHPYAGSNLSLDKRGRRSCRICQRESSRRYQRRKAVV